VASVVCHGHVGQRLPTRSQYVSTPLLLPFFCHCTPSWDIGSPAKLVYSRSSHRRSLRVGQWLSTIRVRVQVVQWATLGVCGRDGRWKR